MYGIGSGEEIALLEGGIIEKIPLKLVFDIKKVDCDSNSYIGKTQYFFNNGLLQLEETFLFLRNDDAFISEDSTGSGINFYKFEQGLHLFGLNKLTFKYNINDVLQHNSFNGKYVLYRSHHC